VTRHRAARVAASISWSFTFLCEHLVLQGASMLCMLELSALLLCCPPRLRRAHRRPPRGRAARACRAPARALPGARPRAPPGRRSSAAPRQPGAHRRAARPAQQRSRRPVRRSAAPVPPRTACRGAVQARCLPLAKVSVPGSARGPERTGAAPASAAHGGLHAARSTRPALTAGPRRQARVAGAAPVPGARGGGRAALQRPGAPVAGPRGRVGAPQRARRAAGRARTGAAARACLRSRLGLRGRRAA